MELNNYKTVTPLKKKRKKITASATLVLCLLSLFIGVLCGKVSADRDTKQQVDKKVAEYKVDYEISLAEFEKEKNTRDDEINRLKKELADANSTIATNEQAVAQSVEDSAEVSAQEDDFSAVAKKEASGGFGRVLIIIVLLAVIGVCGFCLVRIIRKRNDDEYDDDDYYDDDDEYYDEDDEDYDEDDDEYYEDDDEDYDEDDDEYYDEEDDEE